MTLTIGESRSTGGSFMTFSISQVSNLTFLALAVLVASALAGLAASMSTVL